MQSVDEFIEQLLIDKGITDLDPEVKEELTKDMKERLLNQIDQDAIMQLSEEKATELASKIDDPSFDQAAMSEFMKNSGVNLTESAAETMLRFRNFYLTSAGE